MAEPSPRRDPHGWATVLFVPADRHEMLAKAQSRGADAILIDLEDAIRPTAKPAARQALREQFAAGVFDGPSAVCVRINPLWAGADNDLHALCGFAIDGVVLPKAINVEEIHHVRAAIDQLRCDGMDIALIPQVESAAAIVSLGELARSSGISAIALGGEDLCADLGVPRSEASVELLTPRALLALHARAVGLAAIDTVYTAIADEAGLIRETTLARQLGFSWKLLIHPCQIEPVRGVFTPSAVEVAWARRVLAPESSLDGDIAGVRLVDGKMVDAPVVAQAERILARVR